MAEPRMPDDFEPELPLVRRAALWSIWLNSEVTVEEVVDVNFFDQVAAIVDETEVEVTEASEELDELERKGDYGSANERAQDRRDNAYREAFDKIALLVNKGRGH